MTYWDSFELSYQLYDDAFAGCGYSTEAVQLLVDLNAEREVVGHVVVV